MITQEVFLLAFAALCKMFDLDSKMEKEIIFTPDSKQRYNSEILTNK